MKGEGRSMTVAGICELVLEDGVLAPAEDGNGD